MTRSAIINGNAELEPIEYEPEQFFEPCVNCGRAVQLFALYKPQYCCDRHDCDCLGLPVNPVVCAHCDGAVFDDSDYRPVPGAEDGEI